MTSIDWAKLKVLILDVDGTLYDQSKLRKKMLFYLLKYYLFRPSRIKELLILYHFRREREKKAGYHCLDLEAEQYNWCADQLKIPAYKVKAVVQKWIFEFPNAYLPSCVYPDVIRFLELIKQSGIKIAIYSDYDASKKLDYMNIVTDLIVASTDPQINSLKPNPRGLQYIIEALDVKPSSCLFIGDREELDGLCAANAGIAFLNVKKEKYGPHKFFNQLITSFSTQKIRK